MKWWDFSDINFLILFIVILTTFVLLVFFILSFILLRRVTYQYRKDVKEESNSVRIYSINVKNNQVIYFNKSDIKRKRSITLAEFYNRFHPNDVDRIKGWIFEISFNHKAVDTYLEADVMVHRGKDSYFSLLKLQKYDPQVGIIHLESNILKYVTPINAPRKKKKTSSINVGVVKRSQIASIISKRTSITGYTFAVRLFYLKQQALSNNKIERYMSMTLKNEVYPFASSTKYPRQILDVNESEIILFDLRIASREAAIALASSLAKALRRSLTVNGFAGSIDFTIGVCANSLYYQDFDTIVESAERACISAQQNGEDYTIHQKSFATQNEIQKITLEVNHLMNRDALRYLFRPLISCEANDVIGYFEYARAYDSPFSGYSEMSHYAAMVNKNRELFACVAKAVIPKFASEVRDNNPRLFFTVSMMDSSHIWDVISQIPQSKDIKIVLVFDEQEVKENSMDVDYLNNILTDLTNVGFELALLLKDKNLLLDPSVYFNFSYFVAGSAMIGEIKKNNRTRLSIHTLIEQLLKYKKPIIATDLESWQSIELIIKSGISNISSEVVAPSNDMLLPLERKKMDKLSQMWEKYK